LPPHQLRRLVALEFLPKNRLRPGRLLLRWPSLLLEHPRRRRLLRHASVWRLRSGRAAFPRAAAARLPKLACMHSWPCLCLLRCGWVAAGSCSGGSLVPLIPPPPCRVLLGATTFVPLHPTHSRKMLARASNTQNFYSY